MIVGIIQARTGSSRLPRKILLEAAGKTMLEHMIERISNSKKLDKLVVATTTKQNDDVIVELCKKLNIDYFRGSEEDVLSRYADASEFFNATTVVRLCSDSPLLDGSILDNVLDSYISGNYDYVGNLEPGPRTFPDGLSVEVLSSKLLKQANIDAKKPSEREHVFPYVQFNPKIFHVSNVRNQKNHSFLRCTVDKHEDLEFVREIWKRFPKSKKIIHMDDIIKIIDKEPKLLQINKNTDFDEGYKKSLQKDKKLKNRI